MTVQTIPPIEEMTPSQRVELMEELWKVISRRPEEVEPPEWHQEVLKEREQALGRGETHFIDWEDAKAEIRRRTVDLKK